MVSHNISHEELLAGVSLSMLRIQLTEEPLLLDLSLLLLRLLSHWSSS